MLDSSKKEAVGVEGLRSVLTFRMAKTQAALNAQATHILRSRSNLTLVEWRVIQILALYDEAPMSTLAAELRMDKGQLSRRVNAMIEKGLISSEQDSHDQRKNNLKLTPKSIAEARALKPVMEARQRALREGISKSDIDTFYRVLSEVETRANKRDPE